jgi:hypothetical protein
MAHRNISIADSDVEERPLVTPDLTQDRYHMRISRSVAGRKSPASVPSLEL